MSRRRVGPKTWEMSRVVKDEEAGYKYANVFRITRDEEREETASERAKEREREEERGKMHHFRLKVLVVITMKC